MTTANLLAQRRYQLRRKADSHCLKIYLPLSVADRLREIASRQGQTLTASIVKLIEDHREQEEEAQC